MTSISECQQIVDELIFVDPRFAALLNSGGEEGRINVDCRMCTNDDMVAKPGKVAALFRRPPGKETSFMTTNPMEIVLCANNIKKADIKTELTYLATHGYDLIHQRTDFRTCEGLAYSKVRAARDSHCANLPFDWMTRPCVGASATMATKPQYAQFASQCAAAVYDRAMADKHPIPGVVDPLSKINNDPAGLD